MVSSREDLFFHSSTHLRQIISHKFSGLDFVQTILLCHLAYRHCVTEASLAKGFVILGRLVLLDACWNAVELVFLREDKTVVLLGVRSVVRFYLLN